MNPRAIPAAPSFEAERVALLRHLRETPQQSTHSTLTDPAPPTTSTSTSAAPSPVKSGVSGNNRAAAAPPLPSRGGAAAETSSSSNNNYNSALERALAGPPARGLNAQSASTGMSTSTDDLPVALPLALGAPLQLREGEARAALVQEQRDEFATASALCFSGLLSFERAASASAARAAAGNSTDAIQSLVVALEEAQRQSSHAADRLQETYDVLEKMSAELSDSRSMVLQIQGELTHCKEQHAAQVEKMKLEFDLERETWMDRAEAQFMKRVKRLASRVASQEQELIELRAAIGSLRAISAAPGGSELALRLVEDAIFASPQQQQQQQQQRPRRNIGNDGVADSADDDGGTPTDGAGNNNNVNRLFAQQLLAGANLQQQQQMRSGSQQQQQLQQRSGSRLSQQSGNGGVGTNIHITHNHHHSDAAAVAAASAPIGYPIINHNMAVSPPRLAPGLNMRGAVGTGGTKRLFDAGVLDPESAAVRRLIERGYLSPP